MLFVILGVPVGAFLALHCYRVFSLAPVVALFAAGAIVTGSQLATIRELSELRPRAPLHSRNSHMRRCRMS
jgi:hypothetical protein